MKSIEKILVVDDNSADLMLMEEFLKEKFYIKAVSSGQEALHLLNNNSFDLVITDMCMPKMDGFKLIENIKDQWPGMPVIMISATLDKKCQQKALEMNVAAFLNKPIAKSSLMKTIEQVISNSHN